MATAIRPASYAPLDLKRLVAVGHPHKQQVAIRRESAFVPPRVLFALAYVGYVITGVVCCWAPPLAAEEAAGVAIPSDSTCLRATRHADYSTVEVDIPNNDRVAEGCRLHTQASPGRPNSPDYSGAYTTGAFE